MLNQVILVGRLTKDFEVVEKDNKKYATSTIAVSKSYKNEQGIYETDFLDFTTFGSVASNCAEYCQKGDTIGIKGNLSSRDHKIFINAEKITFLATKRKSDDIEPEKDIKM